MGIKSKIYIIESTFRLWISYIQMDMFMSSGDVTIIEDFFTWVNIKYDYQNI